MKALMPRIEITLSQIRHNARILSEFYEAKGISLMGVSKATLGDPAIAEAMIQGGVKFIADSRIENILKMRAAGVLTQFVLLRTALSQAEAVIQNVDISLNTELETVRALSNYARFIIRFTRLFVMVELGDLREGILPGDLSQFIKKRLTYPI
jgi:predicted amino acid racemase